MFLELTAKAAHDPSGATRPLSPTGREPRSSSTPTPATTPWSNSPSATPTKGPGGTPPHQASPRCTPHGSSPSPSTYSAGQRPGPDHRVPVVAKTIHRRVIAIPGGITRSARQDRVHLRRRCPWPHQFLRAGRPTPDPCPSSSEHTPRSRRPSRQLTPIAAAPWIHAHRPHQPHLNSSTRRTTTNQSLMPVETIVPASDHNGSPNNARAWSRPGWRLRPSAVAHGDSPVATRQSRGSWGDEWFL